MFHHATFSVLVFAIALMPSITFAAEVSRPNWLEISTGLIAIPATIIGIVYSYVLIRKTRLETKKTELEIREKETALEKLPQHMEVRQILAPIMDNRIAQYIILRFIILYLIVNSWELVGQIKGIIIAVLYFLFFQDTLFAQDAQDLESAMPEAFPWWGMAAVGIALRIPDVLYWIIFIAFGWPLFKDANALMGLKLKDYFQWGRAKESVNRHDDGV